MATEDQLKWRKGFPPHTGWWNASRSEVEDAWRWFDADKKRWGSYTNNTGDAEYAAMRAAEPAYEDNGNPIKWRHYYPVDARVPSVDPRKA